MIDAILISAAYLLGACPFGLLVAKACGVNIQDVGSGNIGATNVFRMVSKKAGVSVFILDALKGFIPTFYFPTVAAALGTPALSETTLAIGCGVAAFAGHNWPVYLKFKGGKGVATSAGVLLGLAPLSALVGLVGWVALLVGTGYVSIASMVAAILVSGSAWFLYRESGLLLPGMLTMLAVMIIWRHRSNIRRLLNHTEHRFNTLSRWRTTIADDDLGEDDTV